MAHTGNRRVRSNSSRPSSACHSKVMAHPMFGVIVATAMQLINLLTKKSDFLSIDQFAFLLMIIGWTPPEMDNCV